MAKGHKRSATTPADAGTDAGAGAHKKGRGAGSTLYVKNLSDQVSDTDLQHLLYMLFSTWGHLVSINVRRSKLRGQAFIAFANTQSAAVAFRQLNGEEFLGKPMHIEYARTESSRLEWLQNSDF